MTLARDTGREPQVRISETFTSIQGEAAATGALTHFIRLTGCPLRCTFCDTEYAFTGGQLRCVSELVAGAQASGVQHVCVTGGEPLAQPNVHALMEALCDAHLAVSLETSGAIDIGTVDSRVARVVDIKTPASGESGRNLWTNLALLTGNDQVKFVVCDRADFDWSVSCLQREDFSAAGAIYFSPSHDVLRPETLAKWMLEVKVAARLQVQLHKYLWGDARGR